MKEVGCVNQRGLTPCLPSCRNNCHCPQRLAPCTDMAYHARHFLTVNARNVTRSRRSVRTRAASYRDRNQLESQRHTQFEAGDWDPSCASSLTLYLMLRTFKSLETMANCSWRKAFAVQVAVTVAVALQEFREEVTFNNDVWNCVCTRFFES